MRQLILSLVAVGLVYGQTPNSQQVVFNASAPSAVTGLTATAVPPSQFGRYTNYYWIIATYVGGVVATTAPVVVNTDNPIGQSAQAVNLSWQPSANATSYTILRTNTTQFPGTSCNACAVVVSTTGTTFQDTVLDASKTSYSGATMRSPQTANISFDIVNHSPPALVVTLPDQNPFIIGPNNDPSLIGYKAPWVGSVQDTVYNQLTRTFSVDDFGADPNCFDVNNTTDSSAGIQKAIDYPFTNNAGNGLSRSVLLNNSVLESGQIFGSYCISQPVVVDTLNSILDGQGATLRPTFHGGPSILVEPWNVDAPTFGPSLLTGPGQALTFLSTKKQYINLSHIPQIVRGMGQANYPTVPTGSAQFDIQFAVNQTATVVGGSIIGAGAKRINSETNLIPIEVLDDTSTGTTFNFTVNVGGTNYASGNVGSVILNTTQVIEVSYDGANIRAFVDGVIVWTQAVVGLWTCPTYADITVGTEMSHFPEGFINRSSFTGSIDSIRFSNIARNTSNYTPPTTKYTSDANTVLLMNFDYNTNLALAQNLIRSNVDGGTNYAWLVFADGTFESHSTGSQIIKNLTIDAEFSSATVGGVETIATSGVAVNNVHSSQVYWGVSFENNSFYANTHNNIWSLGSAHVFGTCRGGVLVSQNNDVDINEDQVYTANCAGFAEAASNGSIKSFRAEGNFDGGMIFNNDSAYFFWNLYSPQIQNETPNYYVNPRPLGLLAFSGHSTINVYGGLLALFHGDYQPITINGGAQHILEGLFIQMNQLDLPASVIHFVTPPAYPVIVMGSLKSGAITYLNVPTVPWSDDNSRVTLIQSDGLSSLNNIANIVPTSTDLICSFGGDTTIPGGLTCNNATDPTSGAFFNTQFLMPGYFWYTGADYMVTFGLTVFSPLHASRVYNSFFWGGHAQFSANAGNFTQLPLNNINASFAHGTSYNLTFEVHQPGANSTTSPVYTYVDAYGLVNQAGFGYFNSIAQPQIVNTVSPGGQFELQTLFTQDAVFSVTILTGGSGCNGTVTFAAPSSAFPNNAATGTATQSGGVVSAVTVTNGGSLYGVAPTLTFGGCSVQPTYTVTMRGNPGMALQLNHITIWRKQ